MFSSCGPRVSRVDKRNTSHILYFEPHLVQTSCFSLLQIAVGFFQLFLVHMP